MLIPTPFPFMKIFDVIPGWVYALTIAAILLISGVTITKQTISISGLEKDVAELKAEAADLRAANAEAARIYALDVARKQGEHAKVQQEITHAFTTKITALVARHERERTRVDVVRGAAKSAAARDRAASQGNGTTCESVANNNERLYDLVSEGFSLVVESRKLLEQRDTEVEALKGVITNDRAAICGDGK